MFVTTRIDLTWLFPAGSRLRGRFAEQRVLSKRTIVWPVMNREKANIVVSCSDDVLLVCLIGTVHTEVQSAMFDGPCVQIDLAIGRVGQRTVKTYT